MSRSQPPEELVARWETLIDDFPALRADAEARVVRWRWAGVGAAWHRPEPFFHERNDTKPARWLREPPKKPLGATEYGLDDQDRFAVARIHEAFEQRLEEYFIPTEDGVFSALFHLYPPGGAFDVQKIAVAHALWDEGRLQRYERYGGGKWSELETYEYAEDRVVSIVQRYPDFVEPEKEIVEEFDIAYDRHGELESIVVRGTGTVVFERARRRSARC